MARFGAGSDPVRGRGSRITRRGASPAGRPAPGRASAAASLLGLLATLTVTPFLGAQEVETIRARMDNDYFNFWEAAPFRPDQEYTHGMALTLGMDRSVGLTGLVGLEAACATGGSDADDCSRGELSLGQHIYTPRRDATVPLPGERAYAGWLFLRLHDEVATSSAVHGLGVTLGVTGEPSLGRAVQTTWHQVAAWRQPLGWDHQLGFEPGLMLTYEHRRRLLIGRTSGSRVLTLAPSGGVNLGNVRTSAFGRLEARLGWNLPDPLDLSDATSRPDVGAWALLALGGELVARDLFLDGNTFENSVQVERRVPLGSLQAGLALHFHHVRLAYVVTTRSRSYETEEGSHTFSSVQLEIVP